MVDIYKVVEDNVTDKWFKAKFIGEKSYLKGLTAQRSHSCNWSRVPYQVHG